MNEEQNHIEDGSNDRNYFIMIPQIVWGYCLDPHEFTLWCVVKMIAGDEGECYVSTPNLATLCMMGETKVRDARTSLLEKGLLEGELRLHSGYTSETWHLRIPDLWEQNVAWRKRHDKMPDRIAYKEKVAELRDQRLAPKREKERERKREREQELKDQVWREALGDTSL